jgi:hypothetical protein
MAILDRLIRSWRASADLHKFRAGATEADIREFENRAGWKLPTDWSQFYLFSNGADLFEECLKIYPLLGGERSLLGAAARLRRLNWRVPGELWIAGDDGSEDHFGFWNPCATEEKAPVVQMGEIFEDDNLAWPAAPCSRFWLPGARISFCHPERRLSWRLTRWTFRRSFASRFRARKVGSRRQYSVGPIPQARETSPVPMWHGTIRGRSRRNSTATLRGGPYHCSVGCPSGDENVLGSPMSPPPDPS